MKNPKTSIAGIVGIIVSATVAILGFTFPEQAPDIAGLGDMLSTLVITATGFITGIIALISAKDTASKENV